MTEFKPGRAGDSDEKGTEHVTPRNRKKSVNAPAGKFVDVPKSMMAAPDTYVDSHGVLRDSRDNSIVVWHLRPRALEKHGRPPCSRTGLKVADIAYDPKTGAPWCPDCFVFKKIDDENEWKKVQAQGIEQLFGTN